MRYTVEHETVYSYEAPVVVSQQLMHLTPRALPWQNPEAHSLVVDPVPGEVQTREDYFGNPVTQVLIAAPHARLSVIARTTVSVEARTGPGALGSSRSAEPAQFLYESPYVEWFRELNDYAAPSFPAGRGAAEAALHLMRRIHADFAFDPTATSVSTPLREVLKKRRGVCQDFAHFMAGCLRSQGHPARYVSGYILTSPPPGKPRLVGADASHAWVSVFIPGQGWLDLDPTNDCIVSDEHITLAWGRDFSDVTPMRGVILGGGEQTLEVKVTVTPLAANGTPLALVPGAA